MSKTFHHHRRKMTTPMWWIREFMNQPRRAKDRRLLRKILTGGLDADDTAFSLGNRKPHIYYW